jgi:hypothetical protein
MAAVRMPHSTGRHPITHISTGCRSPRRLKPQSHHLRNPKNCPTAWGHLSLLLERSRQARVPPRRTAVVPLWHSAQTHRSRFWCIKGAQSEESQWLMYASIIVSALCPRLFATRCLREAGLVRTRIGVCGFYVQARSRQS